MARLQLPPAAAPDRDFNPESCADAWSAVPEAVGCGRGELCSLIYIHVLERLSFMALIAGGAEAVGPTDKQRYNALLVLADPTDTVAFIVFRAAAGTQASSLQRGYYLT